MAATIASRVTLSWLFAASAAAAGIALAADRRAPAPPPPPPTDVVCLVPDVALQSACTRPEDRIALSTTAPADRGIGALETASGLRVRVLGMPCGTGAPMRRETDNVARVAYVGWNAAGEMITNGVETSDLAIRAIVPGFAEAIEQMTPGETLRAWIPARLAYGEARGAKYGGDLVFDLHLVAFPHDTIGR